MTRTLLAVLAIAAAWCGTLRAQRGPSLTPGQPVRLTVPASGLTNAIATLLAATPESIVVGRIQARSEGGSWRLDTTRIAVPLRDITGLEVLGSRSHVVEGALIGGGSMAVPMYLLVKAMECSSPEQWFCVTPGHATDAAFKAGLIGAGLGALVGIVWRSQEWQSVPLERLGGVRVGLVPQAGGRLGLGVALAF